MLAEYPVFLSSDGFTASNPKHGVFHDLPTVSGPPVFAKARHLDPEKLASAKAESGGLVPLGQAHCTWLKSRTGLGAPVETTGDLTQSQCQTDILYPYQGWGGDVFHPPSLWIFLNSLKRLALEC